MPPLTAVRSLNPSDVLTVNATRSRLVPACLIRARSLWRVPIRPCISVTLVLALPLRRSAHRSRSALHRPALSARMALARRHSMLAVRAVARPARRFCARTVCVPLHRPVARQPPVPVPTLVVVTLVLVAVRHAIHRKWFASTVHAKRHGQTVLNSHRTRIRDWALNPITLIRPVFARAMPYCVLTVRARNRNTTARLYLRVTDSKHRCDAGTDHVPTTQLVRLVRTRSRASLATDAVRMVPAVPRTIASRSMAVR